MGATLEKLTNKFLDAELARQNPHSSLFSKEFSYTAVLGYLPITLQKIRMIPSTTEPISFALSIVFAHLPTAEANATSARKCCRHCPGGDMRATLKKLLGAQSLIKEHIAPENGVLRWFLGVYPSLFDASELQ